MVKCDRMFASQTLHREAAMQMTLFDRAHRTAAEDRRLGWDEVCGRSIADYVEPGVYLREILLAENGSNNVREQCSGNRCSWLFAWFLVRQFATCSLGLQTVRELFA